MGWPNYAPTATVDDVKTAFAAVTALVKRVCCPNDPRRRAAQRSDAVIARLNGVAFECECADPEACTGQPDQAGLTQEQVVIALHIITEQATLNAQPGTTDDGVGYVDGYGVITGDHVRDIAARGDTKISYFPGPPSKQTEPQADSQTEADPAEEPVLDFDAPPQPEAEPESAQPEPEPESESDAHPEFEPDPADDQPAPAVPEPAAKEPVIEAPAPLRKPKPPVLPSPCLRSDPYRFSSRPRPRRSASTNDKHQRRQREREANRAEREAAEAAAERERISNELFKFWRIRFGSNPTSPTNNNEPIEQDDPPPF